MSRACFSAERYICCQVDGRLKCSATPAGKKSGGTKQQLWRKGLHSGQKVPADALFSFPLFSSLLLPPGPAVRNAAPISAPLGPSSSQPAVRRLWLQPGNLPERSRRSLANAKQSGGENVNAAGHQKEKKERGIRTEVAAAAFVVFFVTVPCLRKDPPPRPRSDPR